MSPLPSLKDLTVQSWPRPLRPCPMQNTPRLFPGFASGRYYFTYHYIWTKAISIYPGHRISSVFWTKNIVAFGERDWSCSCNYISDRLCRCWCSDRSEADWGRCSQGTSGHDGCSHGTHWHCSTNHHYTIHVESKATQRPSEKHAFSVCFNIICHGFLLRTR